MIRETNSIISGAADIVFEDWRKVADSHSAEVGLMVKRLIFLLLRDSIAFSDDFRIII